MYIYIVLGNFINCVLGYCISLRNIESINPTDIERYLTNSKLRRFFLLGDWF